MSAPKPSGGQATINESVHAYLRAQATKGGLAATRRHRFTSESASNAARTRWRDVRQERAREMSRQAMVRAGRDGTVPVAKVAK